MVEGSYTGHVLYWTDVVGFDNTFPVTAFWSRSADTSTATLHVVDSTGRRDTIYLQHSSKGWVFAPNDSRSPTTWTPTVIETKDSLMFYMGFGFSGSNYYLKKVN